MDRATSEPLSPEQAKRRLLILSRQMNPDVWVKRHPFEGLLLALLAGMAFGGCPKARQMTSRGLLRWFFQTTPFRRHEKLP